MCAGIVFEIDKRFNQVEVEFQFYTMQSGAVSPNECEVDKAADVYDHHDIPDQPVCEVLICLCGMVVGDRKDHKHGEQ